MLKLGFCPTLLLLTVLPSGRACLFFLSLVSGIRTGERLRTSGFAIGSARLLSESLKFLRNVWFSVEYSVPSRACIAPAAGIDLLPHGLNECIHSSDSNRWLRHCLCVRSALIVGRKKYFARASQALLCFPSFERQRCKTYSAFYWSDLNMQQTRRFEFIYITLGDRRERITMSVARLASRHRPKAVTHWITWVSFIQSINQSINHSVTHSLNKSFN